MLTLKNNAENISSKTVKKVIFNGPCSLTNICYFILFKQSFKLNDSHKKCILYGWSKWNKKGYAYASITSIIK